MPEPRKIPIEWRVPEDLRAIFVNHMLVTEMDGQFIVTFFEAKPPMRLEGEPKNEDAIKSVPATAVVRLAIPPQQIPNIISALGRVYKTFSEASLAAKEGEKE